MGLKRTEVSTKWMVLSMNGAMVCGPVIFFHSESLDVMNKAAAK